MNPNVCVCVRVCAPASQGGCSDSLRLHSSVCIWSRPNEAESLAVVWSICRDRVMGISFCRRVPRGPHTSEDPACCLHGDLVPLCTHAAEGHATYAVDAIWKVCLTATAASHATLDWWNNRPRGWPNTCFGKIKHARCSNLHYLFTCIPPHVIQSERSNWSWWLSVVTVIVMMADSTLVHPNRIHLYLNAGWINNMHSDNYCWKFKTSNPI